MTDEQFSKLPKWAQGEFRKLSANLAGAERGLSLAFGEGPRTYRTPIAYDYIADGGRAVPVETIRWPHFGIEVNATKHGLVVRALDGSIAVEPSASNTIYVTSAPRSGVNLYAPRDEPC